MLSHVFLEATSSFARVITLKANDRLLTRIYPHVFLEETSCCAGEVILCFCNIRFLCIFHDQTHFDAILVPKVRLMNQEQTPKLTEESKKVKD